MIESIEVTDGYAADLPAIKGKKFDFTPGMNVLFGPNGCGKTSLLRIIAAYTLSHGGGWSKYTGGGGFGTIETEGHALIFPDCIVTQEKCKARVAWDGTATYYNHTATSDQPIQAFGMNDDADMEDEIREIMGKPSDGQKRLSRLNKMVGAIQGKVPDLTQAPKYSDKAKAFADYVGKLSRKGPVTILLDEPDRSLSVENQSIIWAGFPNMAKKFQVIISSHSLFPVLRLPDGVNLIDMELGYLAHSKAILDLYVAGKSYSEIVVLAEKLRREEAEKNEPPKSEPPKKKARKKAE